HAELVALHLDLDALRAVVADQLADLLGLLLADALLQGDVDLDLLAGGSRLADVEDLERLIALDQLLLEHLDDRLRALVGVRGDLDRVGATAGHGRAGVLEVEPLRDLAARLVDRVVDLLVVDLADDVERRVAGHLVLLHDCCLGGPSVGRAVRGLQPVRFATDPAGSGRGDRRYSRDVGDTSLGQGNGEPRRTSMLVAPNIDPSSTERLREPDAPGATLIDRSRYRSQETEEVDAMTALTAETASQERCTQ